MLRSILKITGFLAFCGVIGVISIFLFAEFSYRQNYQAAISTGTLLHADILKYAETHHDSVVDISQLFSGKLFSGMLENDVWKFLDQEHLPALRNVKEDGSVQITATRDIPSNMEARYYYVIVTLKEGRVTAARAYLHRISL